MKKHKTLVTVTMSLLVLGLLAAYVPLFFNSKPQALPDQSLKSNQESASLLPVNSPSSSEDKAVDQKNVGSFTDLEKEKKSLEDINKLLDETNAPASF